MVGFIEQAESLNSSTLALYCWRGGMRSESMAWLLDRYGFQTIVLEGGYKAYRNDLLKYFDNALPLQVITGYTGSKKTTLLHLLKQKGEQVVDLEGLAQHQGQDQEGEGKRGEGAYGGAAHRPASLSQGTAEAGQKERCGPSRPFAPRTARPLAGLGPAGGRRQ